MDYDVVELGNLHRQILHMESRVGKHKSASVAFSCNEYVHTDNSCLIGRVAIATSQVSVILESMDPFPLAIATSQSRSLKWLLYPFLQLRFHDRLNGCIQLWYVATVRSTTQNDVINFSRRVTKMKIPGRLKAYHH